MTDAVIVSTARTPIGRAFRGALNNVKSPTLMGHAIRYAIAQAKIEADEVEDVVIGTVLAAGTAGMNVARHASHVAGLPVTTSSQTMDRQCASGLMAVATAAKQIMVDGMPIVVAGGQENISAVQAPYFDWVTREQDRNSIHAVAEAYMPMLQTAEFVAKKYGIGSPIGGEEPEQQGPFALSVPVTPQRCPSAIHRRFPMRRRRNLKPPALEEQFHRSRTDPCSLATGDRGSHARRRPQSRASATAA